MPYQQHLTDERSYPPWKMFFAWPAFLLPFCPLPLHLFCCFSLTCLISGGGQCLWTHPLDLFIIHAHLLRYLVESYGHTDHLHADGFHICISCPHASPQHPNLNVKQTIYISIWVCNRYLIFPMPNYKLLPLPPNRAKNSLFLLYFSSLQFLVTFFRFTPKP